MKTKLSFFLRFARVEEELRKSLSKLWDRLNGLTGNDIKTESINHRKRLVVLRPEVAADRENIVTNE
jgi:hypothetical protein